MRSADAEVGQYYLSEEAELVRDCVRSLGLAHQPLIRAGARGADGRRYGYEYFNDVVACVRARAKHPAFLQRCRRRAERSKRQHASGLRYIDALFARYARLLIIRVDLGYRDGFHDIADTSRVSLRRALEDIGRFLNNSRCNVLFKHRVGYIRKLETGITKGHHFHVFLFFDGSKVLKDVYLAERICDYWEQAIAPDIGLATNVNKRWAGNPDSGVGMCSHDDWIKRDRLSVAHSYLAKTSQRLCLTHDGELAESAGRLQVYARGELPAPRGTRGRTRRTERSSAVLASLSTARTSPAGVLSDETREKREP